jgi:Ca2+-binding EF-hand superfamily protein
MDVNGDGKLSKEEVKNGFFECFGRSLNDDDLIAIFKNADLDKSGTLDYSEFLAATIREEELLNA